MKSIFKKIVTHILRVESKLVLWKYKPKIVAITGSVGKTSTKDAIFAVISDNAYVRKSDKSFNSEIGLPLTILGCPNGWNNPVTWTKNILKGLALFLLPHKYPEWLILEVGVGKPGDMRETASWLRTDAVVITAITQTPPHIEFFNSRKHLIEEKLMLVKTLKRNGILILDATDDTVLEVKNKIKNRVITFGTQEGVDVRGSNENIFYEKKGGVPAGLIFRADTEGASLPVAILGAFGESYVYSALAALALAFGMKWNLVDAVERLKKYDISPGRMRLIDGKNDTLLVDDTYNSSPAAARLALETLRKIDMGEKTGRKIAILGDMLELGKHTNEAHEDIGKIAAGIVQILIVVGHRAALIKKSAVEGGMPEENTYEFLNSVAAGDFAQTFVKPGDIILIKGSQGIRMERTVEALMLSPKDRKKLLVRQDREWQNR